MCKRMVAILLALVLFPAMAPAADLTLVRVAPATMGIDAELGGISLTAAGPGLEIYPLPPTVAPLLPRWRSALCRALARAGIFRGYSGPPPTLSVKVMEFALSGKTLTVFARYRLGGQNPPMFETDIISDAGVTSISNGLPTIDYSARATANHQQVDQAVRRNIAEFIDQLEAFAAQQQIVMARADSGRTLKTVSTARLLTASRFLRRR